MYQESSDGSLSALMDLSFSRFVTMSVIKILYVLAIILAAIFALIMVITAFVQSILGGLIALVISPIVFIIYVLLARVWLEIIMVIFRIEKNTREVADYTRAE